MTAPTTRRFSIPLATVLAAFAVFSACASLAASLEADDNEIEIELNKLLADDSSGLWPDVGTVVYRGRVLLLGSVGNADAKARAGAIGGTAEGVIEVINDIQINGADGAGAHLDDPAIEKSIRTGYLFGEGIDSRNFRVRSVNGTVYLIGQAWSQAELDKALQIARDIGGVQKVVNHVRVVEFSGSCGCEKPPRPLRKSKP